MTTSFPRTIYVFWRAPKTDDPIPIGRLVLHAGSPRFEFVYVKGVENALHAGFIPFPDFPDHHGVYRSDEILPLFSNRLMSDSRPEYAWFLQRHGLAADAADDLNMLLRTDGRRATDRVELFAVPVEEEGGSARICHFFVRGIQPDVEPIVNRMERDTPLRLCPEVEEELTTGLRTEDGTMIGFVPNFVVFDAQDVGVKELPKVFVEQVNLQTVDHRSVPLHHRLLCRLEASSASAERLFRAPRFEPLGRAPELSLKP